MLICPKCHDMFRKQERYDKHLAKCPGKVCRVCGKVGHLACGVSKTFAEVNLEIRQALSEGKQVRIIGLFDE